MIIMDLRFLPVRSYSELLRNTGAQGTGVANAGGWVGVEPEREFDDLLSTELGKYQRVISAEQVLAELDGTRMVGMNGSLGATATYGSLGQGADRAAIIQAAERIAARMGVDADLVREVIRAESNFNPNAVSRAGAKGLMQLMDGTARSLNVSDSFDPVANITGGTQYLRRLLQKYDGNVKVALAAYNAGPGRIDRLGISSDQELEARIDELPNETQRYVAKIMDRLE